MVSEYADDALASADIALRDADRVSHSVMTLSMRIQSELRVKIKEMQSFSPEELANIPRKRKKIENSLYGRNLLKFLLL